MATDLEQFLDQDGRDDAIARVRREIDEQGVQCIYYQFVSVTNQQQWRRGLRDQLDRRPPVDFGGGQARTGRDW